MRKYNISANVVCTTEQLFDKATGAVQMNGSMGEWFRTTVGVRQRWPLSPTLFNIFLEWIMSDALITAALTKLKPIWRDNNISLGLKVKLVISIFLYAYKSRTLTAELKKRTQAFEIRCYRRLLGISYKDHVTNEEVRRKIQAAIGEYGELLILVRNGN